MRWLGHLVRMPPGRLPGEAFRARPTGRRPRGRPRRHAGETMSLGWPGNALGSPRKSWMKWLGKGKSGLPCLGCCPHDPTPDKRQKMDGWIDYYFKVNGECNRGVHWHCPHDSIKIHQVTIRFNSILRCIAMHQNSTAHNKANF